MKFKIFIALIFSILLIITGIMISAPLMTAQNFEKSLPENAISSNAKYCYKMGPAELGLNFSKNNKISSAGCDYNYTVGYVNITMQKDHALFYINIYNRTSPSGIVKLACSFHLDVNQSSILYKTFFPKNVKKGEFLNIFGYTAEDKGVRKIYRNVNEYGTTLYSCPQKITLMNVKGCPTGFSHNLSLSSGGNNASYINTPSHAFLNQICFTGNSTVIAQLFGNTGLINVTIMGIILMKAYTSLSTLNLRHYLYKYVPIVVILWILGIIYMVSVFIKVSKKSKR